MLYTQIFQQVFYTADHKYKGALPIPVHFIMDEFANVSLPDDFDKILATMRSRRSISKYYNTKFSTIKDTF